MRVFSVEGAESERRVSFINLPTPDQVEHLSSSRRYQIIARRHGVRSKMEGPLLGVGHDRKTRAGGPRLSMPWIILLACGLRTPGWGAAIGNCQHKAGVGAERTREMVCARLWALHYRNMPDSVFRAGESSRVQRGHWTLISTFLVTALQLPAHQGFENPRIVTTSAVAAILRWRCGDCGRHKYPARKRGAAAPVEE